MLDQVVSATSSCNAQVSHFWHAAICIGTCSLCLSVLPSTASVGLSKGQLHRLSYEDVVKQLLERMQ